MEDMILQVNHLSKSFGSHEVLRDIDFTVKKGDVTSIIREAGRIPAACDCNYKILHTFGVEEVAK